MKSLEIVNEVLGEDDWGILGREELEQIKQYLEVLEILKNKTNYMLEDEVDRFEIFSLDEKIRKEDFNKVKQWLEENENDR